MPDDTADLDIALVRNDGSDSFDLKVNKVDRSVGYNVVKKGLIAAAGDIAGKDVSLGFEDYALSGQIKATQQDTYPTGSPYPDVDLSTWDRATEKEMALALAAKIWGPDAANGFDILEWGPRSIDGIITKFNSTENRTKNGPEQYEYSLEFTHLTDYVGDD